MDNPTVHERNAEWKTEWDRLRTELDEALKADETVRARRCRRAMDRIQEEFFRANAGLAYDAARPFLTQASRTNHDDYIQAARMGLLKAWPMWDPKKGTFGTFSRPYAEGEVNRTVRAYEHAHISYSDHTAAPRVRSAEEALKAQLDRTPTAAEVAEKAGVSRGIVERVRSQRPISLDAPLGSDGDDDRTSIVADKAAKIPGSAGVELGDLDDAQEEEMLKALRDLPANQAAVCALYFGLAGTVPQTYAEIAETIGGSRESIRSAADAATEALKLALS